MKQVCTLNRPPGGHGLPMHYGVIIIDTIIP